MAELSIGSKKKLLKEVKGRCFYCGIKLIPENTTFDHIIPKAKGGNGRVNNRVACCRGCNSIKWDRLVETFRDIMERSLGINHYKFYYEKINLRKDTNGK